jgi:glucokinase
VTVRVGVDVGGTKAIAVRLDDHGSVVARERCDTPQGADAIWTAITELVEALDPSGEARVGIGLPGLVDPSGRLRHAPNLPGVVGVDAKAELHARLCREVILDNDATCAAIAEWRHGGGRGVEDLVMVTLGTGIGGGILAGGRILRGAHGTAGEIGHMVVEIEGRRCGCGRRGCWERYASGSALADHARVITGTAASGPEVIEAVRRGEGWASEVLEVFIDWVGRGLASLANVVDPARFVIGGGLVTAGDLFLDGCRDALARHLYASEHRDLPEIVLAELGPEAGALGAALLGDLTS